MTLSTQCHLNGQPCGHVCSQNTQKKKNNNNNE